MCPIILQLLHGVTGVSLNMFEQLLHYTLSAHSGVESKPDFSCLDVVCLVIIPTTLPIFSSIKILYIDWDLEDL